MQLSRVFTTLVIACSVIFIFSFLSFVELYFEEKINLSHLRSRIAIVYASPTFHDEVVSVISCILHDLGYYVVVYVGSGVQIPWTGGMMIPFSGRRKRNSIEFYGRCVSQWVTISDQMKFVTDPDVMVFVTYPMLKRNFKTDEYALSMLAKLKEDRAKTSVVFVTHRTNEMIHPTLAMNEALVPRNQTTYMFLGEHTELDASKILQEKKDMTLGDPTSFHLGHFYPVLPFEYINNDGPSDFGISKFGPHSDRPIFAMQGNFGGKHSHRKNPRGVVECLQRIEDGIDVVRRSDVEAEALHQQASQESPTVRSLTKHLTNSSSSSSSFSSSSSSSSSSHRQYLRNSSFPVNHTTSQLFKSGRSHSFNHSKSHFVSLDLIGHLTGRPEDLKIGSLKSGNVRFLSDLPSKDYYRAISRAKFMLAAVGEDDYYTSRATSSIPAALITRIPLVMSNRFLKVYPCLRDAPIHLHMARETECEAMAVAVSLTDEQYAQARAEIASCSALLWSQAQDVFREVAASRALRDNKKQQTLQLRNDESHRILHQTKQKQEQLPQKNGPEIRTGWKYLVANSNENRSRGLYDLLATDGRFGTLHDDEMAEISDIYA